MIVILTGKSGVGKDSIRERLEMYGYRNMVSYTSRPMRDNEIDGREYWFVGEREFINMINNNEMLEYRKYNTVMGEWYYGTKKEEKTGNWVVILDLNGMKKFVDYYGKENCYVVNIKADDKIRKERAIKRGSFNNKEWERRLKTDDRDFDLKTISEYSDLIISNNKNDNNSKLDIIAKTIDEKIKEKVNDNV